MEAYYEKYSYTQDYIEASSKKYQNKGRKELDFIQFDSHSLQDCISDLSNHCADELKKYEEELKQNYSEMGFYFETGENSILVAGYGSKYDFLNKFVSEHLSNYPIIAVNGFINGLTIKYILNKICDFIKKHSYGKASDMDEEGKDEKKSGKQSLNIETQLQFMRSVLDVDHEDSDLKFERVVLLIHSIDGKSLRSLETQSILSTIASMKKVTVIASMDNFLYQSLLSPQILTNYNFKIFYIDTYAPYKREFQYLEDVNYKGNRKGADALKYIFKSFTTNQKEIVKTLAKHLFDNPSLQGVEFKQLFKLCFDHAMISSESQLKENLLEVLDHKVIRETKGEKGRILYTMEFPRSILEQIIEDKFE